MIETDRINSRLFVYLQKRISTYLLPICLPSRCRLEYDSLQVSPAYFKKVNCEQFENLLKVTSYVRYEL